MNRPICQVCKQKPCGINYIKEHKKYYRSKCDSCIRKAKKIDVLKPRWAIKGYKKKLICDKCKFRAKWAKQILVYYIDGNLNNTNLSNLKSICLNCSVAIEKEDLTWVKDLDIKPDF